MPVNPAGARGTGLGMGIAHKAVEAMGGRIWVESEVGKGSTFFVALSKTPPPSPRGDNSPLIRPGADDYPPSVPQGDDRS